MTSQAELCGGVVECNAEEDVTWLHSYVSEDNRSTFSRLRRVDPAAVGKTAARNGFASTGSPRCAYSTPTSARVRWCDAQMRTFRAGFRGCVGRRDSARGADSRPGRLWSGQRAPGDDWRS